MPQLKVTDSMAAKASRPAPKILRAFRDRLPSWYNLSKRDLPWRHTHDPYAIAVSEFMLQQTQVVTALPFYQRWMRQYPDWKRLATAPMESVLKSWEGLGYYQRARNLQKLAQAVAASASGELPSTVEALQQLPGIGAYTARAIASFAFGGTAAVLDGNVIRVLTRVFAIPENVANRDVLAHLWKLADALIPPDNANTYNQAIMELGALVCLPRKPACLLCPLETVCAGKTNPESYPVKQRAATKAMTECIAVIQNGNRWWCEKTASARRLAEFWRFPDFDANSMIAKEEWMRFKYTITNHRIDLTARIAHWKKAPAASSSARWLRRDELESLPFSAAHRRIVKRLLEKPL